MQRTKFQRAMALFGVAVLLLLIILTVVFLLIGNTVLAITCIAVNGFLSIVLYFILRFHRHVVDDEPELDEIPDENENIE